MKVRLTPRADAHLQSAFNHISEASPAAAKAVMARIEHALGLLGEFPTMGRPGAKPDTREFAVPRTRYVVIYAVTDCVEVVAVLHSSQNRST